MARFRFRAVAASGERVEGELEAASQSEVVDQLRSQGHLPLLADPVSGDAGAAGGGLLARLRQPLFGRARITRRDLSIMTRELATLLDAGLSLDQSLRLMIELVENPAVRDLLQELLEAIKGGSTLADALAAHDEVFSEAYVGMVRAGEAGGSLNDVLARLALWLDNAEVLAERVRAALVYPLILLVMAGLSIAILLTVVLPQFTALFESAEAELPLLTRVIIAIGDFVQRTWWLILLAMVAFTLWFRRALRVPESRAWIDRMLLAMPLAGDLATKLDTARFARTLSTLLANGVPVLQALAIVRATLINSVLRDAVGQAAAGAKEGQGVARPLERTRRFPKLALHLIGVGEGSGRLEPMLMKVAEVYDREVQLTIDRMMSLLVPVLTIGLGIFIAAIIGAILSAILQAYQLPL
ncbi:MAG: type II secretion system F family protein [Geminicoccaceae bacterium]|nr:type II secretion system F family protein [Geminicoccaceae bacterium]